MVGNHIPNDISHIRRNLAVEMMTTLKFIFKIKKVAREILNDNGIICV